MRGLETSDVFSAARIIRELNLKDKIKDIALNFDKKKNTDIRVMGFDIVWTIIENASTQRAEALIYDFIGKLLEMSAEEVSHMNPTTMMTQLIEVANIEEWKNFFKYVLRVIQAN